MILHSTWDPVTLPCHYYAADRFDIHHPKTISEFPSVLLQSESSCKNFGNYF